MMLRTETENPLNEAYAHLLEDGLDGPAEALRILSKEASVIERRAYLKAAPFERSIARVDHANGYKNKTMLSRLGEIDFAVSQVRGSGFDPSTLEKGSRSEEIKGRTRAATLFPNPESCLRLVGALLSEQDEEWLSAKIYLTMKPESIEK